MRFHIFFKSIEATCRLSSLATSIAILGELSYAYKTTGQLFAIGIGCSSYCILAYGLIATLATYGHPVSRSFLTRHQHIIRLLLDCFAIAVCGVAVVNLAGFFTRGMTREAWMQNSFDPKLPGDPWRTIACWHVLAVGAMHVVLLVVAALDVSERALARNHRRHADPYPKRTMPDHSETGLLPPPADSTPALARTRSLWMK